MHKAIVAKITDTYPINGAENIQVAVVLGEKVVVSKGAKVGDTGVFFEPDLQLSVAFCHQNNLFRDKNANSDKEKTGFFEDNRRVRAQTFMKVKSCGFFATPEQFLFAGGIPKDVGAQFDELNGVPICQKYINERTARIKAGNQQKKVDKRVTTPLFKEHVDTEQFKYCVENILPGTLISFHNKYHGTSGRYAHTKVVHKLPWWKRMINRAANVFPTETYEYVVGTRRVSLYGKGPHRDGFHGSEQFRYDVLDTLKAHMPRGMTIYGEIVGYANGNPIMGMHNAGILKDKTFEKKYGNPIIYSYGCKEWQHRFIVYRITITGDDGATIDLTYPQLANWCKARDIEYSMSIAQPVIYDGDAGALAALVESLTERPDVLSEDYDDPSIPCEGVIVRVDGAGLTPKFYKSKSFAFRVMEGLAKEVDVDIEDAS